MRRADLMAKLARFDDGLAWADPLLVVALGAALGLALAAIGVSC